MNRPPNHHLRQKLWAGVMAFVWLTNGLWCKLLNGVPRHRSIVAAILGTEHAALTTQAIGAMEVLMAVWILSGIRSRVAAIMQIVAIACMNILEYILTPGLLLFGRWNALFATVFITLIALNEWTKPTQRPVPPHTARAIL